MKIKLILLALISSVTIGACSNTKNQLLINTITVTGADDKRITKDSLATVDSEYFEVSLSSMGKGKYYTAQKDLEKPVLFEEFRMVSFYVVDKDTSVIKFKNSTDFLNFMSEKGYELKDQKAAQYHTDYTFKKK